MQTIRAATLVAACLYVLTLTAGCGGNGAGTPAPAGGELDRQSVTLTPGVDSVTTLAGGVIVTITGDGITEPTVVVLTTSNTNPLPAALQTGLVLSSAVVHIEVVSGSLNGLVTFSLDSDEPAPGTARYVLDFSDDGRWSLPPPASVEQQDLPETRIRRQRTHRQCRFSEDAIPGSNGCTFPVAAVAVFDVDPALAALLTPDAVLGKMSDWNTDRFSSGFTTPGAGSLPVPAWPTDPQARIAVLVHGLFSNPQVWAGSGFPAFLTGLGYTDVWGYQYDSLRPISVNAADLAGRLAAVLVPGQTIDLYAHSMGGLLARYTIEVEIPLATARAVGDPSGLGPQVARLVTLGTPHAGTPLVDLLAADGMWALASSFLLPAGAVALGAEAEAADTETPQGIQDMSPTSAFFTTLNALPAPSQAAPTVYFAIGGRLAASTGQSQQIMDLRMLLDDALRAQLYTDGDGVVPWPSANLTGLDSEAGNVGGSPTAAFHATVALDHLQLPSAQAVRDILTAWFGTGGTVGIGFN